MAIADAAQGSRRVDHDAGSGELALGLGSGRARSTPTPRSITTPMSATARGLLADASRELAGALRTTAPAERFAAAHLAALRAAAAVLAARARPALGRRTSAWDLLARVAPELGEWAAFFAAGSPLRQAVQAGLPRTVSERLADDMVRQSAAFLELATAAAGPRGGPSGGRADSAGRGSGGVGPPRRARRSASRTVAPSRPLLSHAEVLGRPA